MPKLATHNELNDQGSVDREFDNIYRQLNVSSSSTSYPTISSGSGAPSSTPGKVGDIYLDTTAKREYRAYGTSSSADWLKVPVFYSGTATITTSDLTITLPWDWSGGKIEVYRSANTAQWVPAYNSSDYQKFEASYDSLTNAAYTTYNSMYLWCSGASGGEIGANGKTANLSGMPKSATSTTVVLDSDTNTRYVKYFIWA